MSSNSSALAVISGMETEMYPVWNYTDPPTIAPFWFEKCDKEANTKFFHNYWTLSIWASGIYLVLIYFGKKWMKNREPFKLRGALILWNLGLAVFSNVAFFRMAPELIWILNQENGLYRSFCVRENFNESTAFWGRLFILSKVVELGDTFFIVMRKRPLIFLHWWHHISVLVGSWMVFNHYDPLARWLAILNIGVHSLMYTYYTLTAMKFRIPKGISMALTTVQLGQFVWVVSLSVYGIYLKSIGIPCALSTEGAFIYLPIGFSYLVLFANYFYQTYIAKKAKKID